MGQGGARFRRLAGIDLVVPGREWIKGDGDDAMFYWIDPVTLKPSRKPVQLLLFNDLLVVVQASRIDCDYALEYLNHFDLQEDTTVCTKSSHHLIFSAVRRGGDQAEQAEDGIVDAIRNPARPEIQVFASEIRPGSSRARQHVQVGPCDSSNCRHSSAWF